MGIKFVVNKAQIHTALSIAVALLFGSAMGSGAAFQNGSFDSPVIATVIGLDCPGIVTGWTHGNNCANSSELLTTTGFFGLATLDGGEYITFGGNGGVGGTLEQTFDTMPGTIYTVNYLIAIQQNIGPAQSMKVEAFNGVTLLNSAASGDFLFATLTPGPTLTFTAATTSTTLRFTDLTSDGNSSAVNWALDTVTIGNQTSGVPEPGTFGLLFAGLGALALSTRKFVGASDRRGRNR